MKLLSILSGLMLLFASQINAQSDISGKWESDKKDVQLEFFKEGSEYKARILWGNQAVEKDGKTSKKDTKNPNKELQKRNILGSVILVGLKWDGEEFVGGKIYNPPSGDTYKCKVWTKDGKLYLRGYLGMSLLGKTQAFHRLE